MKPRKGPETHHVVHNPQGGWDVKRGGAERASSHHDTNRKLSTRDERSAAIKAQNYESITSTVKSEAVIATAVIRTRLAGNISCSEKFRER